MGDTLGLLDGAADTVGKEEADGDSLQSGLVPYNSCILLNVASASES